MRFEIRNLDESHKSCLKAAYAKKFARKQMCLQMAHQEAVEQSLSAARAARPKDRVQEGVNMSPEQGSCHPPDLVSTQPAKCCAQDRLSWNTRVFTLFYPRQARAKTQG